jgi:hypothetical protein
MMRIHYLRERDNWMGGNITHNEVARQFNYKLLPGCVYNYCPNDRNDKPKHALVLHYKGKRKKWMLPEDKEELAQKDIDRVHRMVHQFDNKESLVLYQ